MRPAALAMGDQMRLANSTLERTKARLEGCVYRIKELQDQVSQLKRDGLLAVDSVSRRLPATKYQVFFGEALAVHKKIPLVCTSVCSECLKFRMPPLRSNSFGLFAGAGAARQVLGAC